MLASIEMGAQHARMPGQEHLLPPVVVGDMTCMRMMAMDCLQCNADYSCKSPHAMLHT